MLTLLTALTLGFGTAQADQIAVFSGSGTDLNQEVVAEGGSPEYYLVAPGDTLWEIAQAFLGNPYYWPRLWSINDYITNPHWIYPGNRIVFRMGSLIEPPSVELETSRDGFSVDGLDFEDVEIACGPDLRFDHTLSADKYTAPAFLRKKKNLRFSIHCESTAAIGNAFLAEDNLVYVRVDDPDAYECGDILSVYRPVKKKVRHPKIRRQKYGNLYRILGGSQSRSQIRRLLERDRSRVLYGNAPRRPRRTCHASDRRTEVGQPRGDLEGQIIARTSQERVLTTIGETIFIDRGRADGVRVGNSFYVVAREDEVVDTKRSDLTLPPSVIGRLSGSGR